MIIEARKDELICIFTIFGEKEQTRKLNEEVYELIDAINCDGSREHIVEEIADVMVVLNQLIVAYSVEKTELSHKMNEKISRTMERIKSGYYFK